MMEKKLYLGSRYKYHVIILVRITIHYCDNHGLIVGTHIFFIHRHTIV